MFPPVHLPSIVLLLVRCITDRRFEFKVELELPSWCTWCGRITVCILDSTTVHRDLPRLGGNYTTGGWKWPIQASRGKLGCILLYLVTVGAVGKLLSSRCYWVTTWRLLEKVHRPLKRSVGWVYLFEVSSLLRWFLLVTGYFFKKSLSVLCVSGR